jgi:glycosyltransferase involved in cell wall biosynthesis
MRIAVLSLCRDRLAFTRHCFQSLDEFAGIHYDHFVLDNGSEDGTVEWLTEAFDRGAVTDFISAGENLGVSRGMNRLLDHIDVHEYDVIVKFDNDCELTTPDTLKACTEVAVGGLWIASPHIQGLDHPPSVEREAEVMGYRVGVPNIMGGIFMAAPASLYATYRHDVNNPIWGMDDAKIVPHWREQGGEVGYLLDYPARHYLSTQGQRRADPQYFLRKDAEFA